MPYFWRAIENKHVRKSRRSKRNGSPLFITFFTLLQRARRSQVLFLQRLIYSLSQKKTKSCVAPCIYRFCFADFAGTSASAYRVGSSKASELVWKPAQFKCFEHLKERTFGLQGKHSSLFARLLLLLSSSFDTRTRTRQKQRRTCTSMFSK